MATRLFWRNLHTDWSEYLRLNMYDILISKVISELISKSSKQIIITIDS